MTDDLSDGMRMRLEACTSDMLRLMISNGTPKHLRLVGSRADVAREILAKRDATEAAKKAGK